MADAMETGLETKTMEFRLISPKEDGFIRRIEWNKEEIEAAVREKMEDYQNVVYTEETLGDAKKDRAELNGLIKEIEDRRKEVKKIINAPYDVFEAEVKEIVAIIKEPVGLIDRQVKQFEKDQKEAKRKELLKAYEEAIGDLADVLPFDRVFDPRYLNKSFKIQMAKDEIAEKAERVKTDLESIDGLESKYRLNAKDVYIKTLDLSQAMAENRRLLELEEKLEADRRQKEAEEAERRRIAEERRKAEEARKAEEKARIEAENARRAEEDAKKTAEEEDRRAEQEKALAEADEKLAGVAQRNAVPEEEKAQPRRYKVRFEAVGTREQLEKLVAYMNENSVQYSKIQ